MSYYGQEVSESLAKQAALTPRQLSVKENLQQQKQNLMDQLATVQAALDAMDRNPGIEEVLTLLSRAGRF